MKIDNINDLKPLLNQLILYKKKIFYKILYFSETNPWCIIDNQNLYQVSMRIFPEEYTKNYYFTKQELSLFFEDFELFKGE